MNFFRVPRLGSYLAIALNHQTCLFEEALDNAVADFQEFQRKKEALEREKAEWDEFVAKD
jgi:hypothetical protein